MPVNLFGGVAGRFSGCWLGRCHVGETQRVQFKNYLFREDARLVAVFEVRRLGAPTRGGYAWLVPSKDGELPPVKGA